jgi:hypothetical protein
MLPFCSKGGALSLRFRRTVRFGCAATLLLLSPLYFISTSTAASFGHSGDAASTTLRFHASGEWSIDPVTTVGGGSTELDAVSCISPSSCVAVGVSYAAGSNNSRSAAETWDGTTWSATATPPVLADVTTSQLLGVSCVSTNFCIAVGSDERGTAGTTELTERWNGTSWSELPISPPSGVRVSQLRSVSCVSSTSCTAVGDGYKGLATAVSIGEQFNGVQWTSQSIPFPAGASYVQLQGVSCPSSRVCVAVGTVGSRSPSSGGEFTLADRWNGTKWIQLSSVNTPGALYRGFEAVSCPTNAYCIAVGNDTNRAGENTTLSEVLTGSKWSSVRTPATPGGDFRNLFGVSCPSTTDCVAVGYYDTVGRIYNSVADQWSGTAWARQPTPNATIETVYSELFGVSCSTSACSAVGNSLAISES